MALLLPEPVTTEVHGLRRACGDGALGRVGPHLTLVPPVNVGEDRLADALAVVRAAASAHGPLTLSLGPPETFWPDTPVLYLGVADPGPVEALRDAVFREPLARSLTWSFHPHVTLADEMTPDRIEAARQALSDYRADARIEAVTMLQEGSDRSWRPVADYALGEVAVIGRGGLALELAESSVVDPQAAELAGDGSDAGEGGLVITARRDGSVVGVATGRVGGAHAILEGLVVAGEARRQGVGRHLLDRFAHAAHRRDARVVEAQNGAADDGFLAAHGWSVVTRPPSP